MNEWMSGTAFEWLTRFIAIDCVLPAAYVIKTFWPIFRMNRFCSVIVLDMRWQMDAGNSTGSIIAGIPPKSHTHTHSARNRPFACSFTTHCPQLQRNACKIAFLWLLFRYPGVWANEQFVDAATQKKPTKNYNIRDHQTMSVLHAPKMFGQVFCFINFMKLCIRAMWRGKKAKNHNWKIGQ